MADVIDLSASDDDEADDSAVLPPRLVELRSTKKPAVMEQQLARLVNKGLRAALSRAEVLGLMQQLTVFFEPFVTGYASARSVRWLQDGNRNMQLAIRVGDMAEVLCTLRHVLRLKT